MPSVKKLDYMAIFEEILYLELHLNRITGSRVSGILLNRWILPIGRASAVEGLLSTGPTPSSFLKLNALQQQLITNMEN